MKYFKKRPIVITAIQWNGVNTTEINQFLNRQAFVDRAGRLQINILEDTIFINKDDWIIRDVQGEFYPCKPDIFEITYEQVNPPKEEA